MHYFDFFASFVNDLALFLLVIIVILGKTNIVDTLKSIIMIVPEYKFKITEYKKAEEDLKKTRAETERIKAETKRIDAETLQILATTEIKLIECESSIRTQEICNEDQPTMTSR